MNWVDPMKYASCFSFIVACLVCGCSEKMAIVEFKVPDMMCEEGCGAATHDILSDQYGVKDVKVDFPAKIVTVVASKKKFDAGKALDELIDHGFENSTVKKSADQ